MLQPAKLMGALLTGAFLLSLTTVDAEALFRKPREFPSGYVTAHSSIGNGSMTVPVRKTRGGYYEMQLPSGRWMDCEMDCEVTLRNKVLDFWDNMSTRSYPGRGITFSFPGY